MVPAEEFLTAIEAEWTKDGENIVIANGETPILICEGTSLIGEREITSVYNGETLYMPLRAVCEGLGKTVFWRANTSGVYIR